MATKREGNFSVKWVPIDDLVVNPKYQRNINRAHVNKINEHFDAHCVTPIRTCLTDIGNEIVDGQHTWEVLKLQGWRAVPTISLNGGTTEKEAASYFGTLNSGRKGLRPIEMFHAAVAAENPRALELKRICASAGLQVTGSKGPNSIAAVRAIEEIYEDGGEAALKNALYVATNAWDPADDMRLDRRMLLGIHEWLVAGGEIGRTIDRLSRISPQAILRKAQMESGYNTGHGIGVVVSREIGRVYRKRAPRASS